LFVESLFLLPHGIDYKKKKKKREQIIKLQNATMPTTTQKEGNKIINIMQLFRQR
jgi:hypothetical protein